MADKHLQPENITPEDKVLMQHRLLAFIFPNTPVTDSAKAAFDKAVQYQIEHEYTIAQELEEVNLVPGTAGFQIGNFRMNFEKGTFSNVLTKHNLCPSAYSVLLREGLLYRGLESG